MPSVEEMREMATAYREANPVGLPNGTITEHHDADTDTFIQMPKGSSKALVRSETRTTQGEKPSEMFGDTRVHTVQQVVDSSPFLGTQSTSSGASIATRPKPRTDDPTIADHLWAVVDADHVGSPLQSARGFAFMTHSMVYRAYASQYLQAGDLVNTNRNIENTALDNLNLDPVTKFFALRAGELDKGDISGSLGALFTPLEKRGVGDKLKEISNLLIRDNDLFMAKTGLALGNDEVASIMYNFGQGASSLLTSIGLTIVTKNPSYAAVVFGIIAESEGYLKAIEAGKSPKEALGIAMALGTAESAVEFVGGGQFLKVVSSGKYTRQFFSRFAVSGGIESTQESVQTGLQIGIEQVSGIDDKNFEEAVTEMAGSAFYAFFLGGGSGSIGGVFSDRVMERLKNDPDLVAEMVEAMEKDIIASMENESEINNSNKTTIGKSTTELHAQFAKQFEAFAEGKGIKEAFETQESRDKLADKVVQEIQDRRVKKSAEVITTGRIKSLASESTRLTEELADLEQEGEQFAETFLEEFQPKGIDEAFAFESFQEEDIEQALAKADPAIAIERTREFKRIKNRAESIRKRVDEIGLEQTRIEGLATEDVLTEAGRGDLIVSLSAITKADQDVVAAFNKGLKQGVRQTKEATKTAQAAVTKMIESFPISDKAKSKLKDRIKEVTGDSKILAREIDKIINRAKASSIRETRNKTIDKISSLIKKNVAKKEGKGIEKSKVTQPISDMLGRMKNILNKRNNLTTLLAVQQRQDQLSIIQNTGGLTSLEAIELQFGHIVSQGAKADVFALLELHNELAEVIKTGKENVTFKNQQREERINISKRELINLKNKSKKTLLKEASDAIINESSNVQHMTDFVDLLAATYNTMRIAMTPNIAEMDFNENDVSFRTAMFSIRDRMNDWVTNNTTHKAVKQYYNNKKKFRFIFEYEMGHKRIQKEIFDKDGKLEATTIVMEYFKAQKYESDLTLESSRAQAIEAFNSMPEDFHRETTPESEDFNKGQLIQRLMEIKNRDVRASVQDLNGDMGYSDAMIADMQSKLTAMDLNFMDMLFAQYEESYHRINEVFKEMYNVSLPKVEFYTSLAREQDARDGAEIGVFQALMESGTFIPGMLMARTGSRNKLVTRNVLDVMSKYFNDSEYFIAYAEKLRDATAIIEDSKVKRSLTAVFGKGAYANLNSHLKLISNHGQNNTSGSSKLANYFRKTFMFGVLGLKGSIGIAQTSSIFAFGEGIPAHQFALHLAKNLVPTKGKWDLLRQHTTFRNRSQSFDNEFEDIFDTKTLRLMGEQNKFQNALMLPIRAGDAFAVYGGAYARIGYHVSQGMSEQEALNEAAQFAERSQQSTLQSNLTLLQKNKNPFVRLTTMFTSSPVAMINMQMQAISRYKQGEMTLPSLYRKLAIYQVLIPAFFAWGKTGYDDEAEDDVLKQVLSGPWSGMPYVGGGMELIATLLTNTISEEAFGTTDKLTVWRGAAISAPMGDQLEQFGFAVNDILTGKAPVGTAEFYEAIAEALDFLVIFPTERAFNIYKGIDDIAGGEEKKGFMEVFGYSESVAEKASE